MRRLIVATVVAVGLLGVEAGVASADIYLNVQQGQWVSGAIGNCVWSAATGQYILASYTEMDYWGPQCTGAGYEVVNVRGHNALVWDPAAVNVSYLEYPSGVAGRGTPPSLLGTAWPPTCRAGAVQRDRRCAGIHHLERRHRVSVRGGAGNRLGVRERLPLLLLQRERGLRGARCPDRIGRRRSFQRIPDRGQRRDVEAAAPSRRADALRSADGQAAPGDRRAATARPSAERFSPDHALRPGATRSYLAEPERESALTGAAEPSTGSGSCCVSRNGGTARDRGGDQDA